MKYECMDRRGFLKTTGLGLTSLALAGYVRGASAQQRLPNIVFILADDLGHHQLGCQGNPFYETPHIDGLARQGMRFTEAYSAAPTCSPTRASLMTGKYPARLHLTEYIPGAPIDESNPPMLQTPDWTKYLPLEEVTLAEVLQSAGYVTGHFGKWHLNVDKHYAPCRPGDPASQGFDEVLTTWKPIEEDDPEEDPHNVHAITRRSIRFIKDHKDEPFFCYVTHNSIHRPQMEDPDLVAKYARKPDADEDRNQPVLGAMVEVLDDGVGRILETLDEQGLTDNTIVVFYSDNGGLGDHNVLKPLRGGKASVYEGGIKVPLIVRWPGVVEPGSECDVPVNTPDFFPTFLELCNMPVTDPDVDGVSIMPLLKQTGGVERDVLCWHYPHYHHQGIAPSGAIRMGDYKLIEWFEKSIDGIETEGALELYNLKEDISEQHDLSQTMPEKRNELYRELVAWRERVGAQMMDRR